MTKTDRILQAVQELSRDFTGQLGFGFYDFTTGEQCYLRENQPMPTASVFKIFLLAELMRQDKEGIISLADRIEVTPENASPGSGILSKFAHRADLSVHDAAVLMMALSDNTATDRLFALAGRDNIKKSILEPLGLDRTKVDFDCTTLIRQFYRDPVTDEKISGHNNPWFRCETELSDCTSPRDMITMLRALHDGTLLGREASDRMLAIMKPIPARARIGKYLPTGVEVFRKTGTLTFGLCNDAGIVRGERGEYAIMIFYNGNLGSREEYFSPLLGVRCDELLAQISRAVWEILHEA